MHVVFITGCVCMLCLSSITGCVCMLCLSLDVFACCVYHNIGAVHTITCIVYMHCVYTWYILYV